jgi:hypothetical protein
MQSSLALQQGTVEEQLWFVSAHAAAALHVPLVAPAGISQALPAQQSPSTVQLPLSPTQEGGAPVVLPHVHPAPLHAEPSGLAQDPLQQSVAAAQLPPVSLQVGDEPGRRHA